jgi:hypothetical protein
VKTQAVKHFEKQLRKAKKWLTDAESRGDIKGAENLQEKIAILEFTIEKLNEV